MGDTPISDERFNNMCQNLGLKEIGKKLRDLSWRETMDRRLIEDGRVTWTFRVSDGVPNCHEAVKDILAAWTAWEDESQARYSYTLRYEGQFNYVTGTPDGLVILFGWGVTEDLLDGKTRDATT